MAKEREWPSGVEETGLDGPSMIASAQFLLQSMLTA